MTNRRPYQLRLRAESQAETRRRITEATVELHGTLGPSKTTISDIARKAGVQRLTVYTHFPDQRSLFAACTQHYFGIHPPPDPTSWDGILDLLTRIRESLETLYAYYRVHRDMFANWLRDAQLMPVLSEFAEDNYYCYLDLIADAVLNSTERAPLRAAYLVALHFESWRVLADRHHLDDERAAAVMARGIVAAGTE
jgi:AcrR family transcriptional regulator